MRKNSVKCPCGGSAKFALTVDFKIGTGDGSKLVSDLPKNSEGVLPLDVYVCDCGRVPLSAPKEIQSSLSRIANK